MPTCLDNKGAPVFEGCYPLGFNNPYAFANFIFGIVNHSDAPDDLQLAFHGSAVTGKSWDTGKPFDQGRVSDFDIALISQVLWDRLSQAGVKSRSTGGRTGELQPNDITALQLDTVAKRASDLVQACSTQNRPCHFMIYQSESAASKGGKATLMTTMNTGLPKGRRVLLLADLRGSV
jgi:filamentous hemagglutinin